MNRMFGLDDTMPLVSPSYRAARSAGGGPENAVIAEYICLLFRSRVSIGWDWAKAVTKRDTGIFYCCWLFLAVIRRCFWLFLAVNFRGCCRKSSISAGETGCLTVFRKIIRRIGGGSCQEKGTNGGQLGSFWLVLLRRTHMRSHPRLLAAAAVAFILYWILSGWTGTTGG